jgi:hypothetical protein
MIFLLISDPRFPPSLFSHINRHRNAERSSGEPAQAFAGRIRGFTSSRDLVGS